MKLFLQKKCKIFERWGLRPKPPATRGFAPDPPNSPHCEFLATRLGKDQLHFTADAIIRQK